MFAVEVTPGVAWVEIPEAGLRVLCGCPGDTIKHLMRRGYIRPTTVKGVVCETGPNAILLSDVMIQGGDFSNLAEFPVLQMFYRQGMLLPGHPNNTGSPPLLIGRKEQVDAQIRYIYRGNYGLISEEELVAAGVDAERAHEMMRLKLRFAFGRIQNPNELLSSIAFDAEVVEILPGVTIRRLALNIFEFAYGEERVRVNLNLPPQQGYECPYSLGFSQFKREYFAVLHLGEGDGWDIRRPSMGSIVVFQGLIYLVDAGPNLSHALTALGIGINEIEGIFHTHCHDDHFAGLTTLLRSDRRIKYYAVPMVRSSVSKKLSALLSIEEDDFDCYFDVHDLVVDNWNDINGLEVKPIFSPHPVETTIFNFRAIAETGYRSYAHFADIVGLKILEQMVVDDAQKPGLSRGAFERIVRDYQEPADIKKVDIGGGLIHGNASDFAKDRSGKIILAHTSVPLTTDQKKTGSGASFGTLDILIPSDRDFLGRIAFHLLSDYFSTVNKSHLGALLNGKIVTFNPETILIRGGEAPRKIYLLLTGLVEVLDLGSDLRSELSAGALLGEISCLHSIPSSETYRAVSFVQALEISCDLFMTFVQHYNVSSGVSQLIKDRAFLMRTWLLGGVVSTGTLNSVAKNMVLARFAAGDTIENHQPALGLIVKGEIVRSLGTDVLETLGPGDFFGEEMVIYGVPSIATLRAKTAATLYVIAADVLATIPNVRWKLFETFERRTGMEVSATKTGMTLLSWHDEYSVNIQHIDAQHKKLFATANKLIEGLSSNHSHQEVSKSLDFLLKYTTYHFAEEESLLKEYGYPHSEDHCHRHKVLLDQVHGMEDKLSTAGQVSAAEMLEFLHGWIVNHILIEDRKYAEYLNDLGVF
jgi:hemerythrin